MPSKKISIECPICHENYIRYSHSITKAINQSGRWLCKACSMKKRNCARSRPLMSKRKKGECVEVKTENGWMLEHRYVMQQHTGRMLYVDEAVHHKNRIRDDNRLENLELMNTGDHTRLHHTGMKRSALTRAKISQSKKGNCVYENHGSYKHITIQNLKKYYLKYGSVARASIKLDITRRTFYNKLKHFNLTLEKLCQA